VPGVNPNPGPEVNPDPGFNPNPKPGFNPGPRVDFKKHAVPGFATPEQAADAYLKSILELDVDTYLKFIKGQPEANADLEDLYRDLKNSLPDRDDAFRRRAALNTLRMELVTNDVSRYPPLPAGPTRAHVYLAWPVSFATGPTLRRLEFMKIGDQWYLSADERHFRLGQNHGFPNPPPPGARPLIGQNTSLATLDYGILDEKNLRTPEEIKSLLPKLKLSVEFDDAGKIISIDPASFLDSKGLQCVYSQLSPRIQRLIIHGGGHQLSDADFEKLSRLTGLEVLDISGEYSQATDKGLAHLGMLSNLKTLRLGAPLASDAGFAFLASLPRLEDLSLRGRISDASLQHLTGASKLRGLFLDRGRVQGPGLEHLRGLKELSTLSLNRNKLTGPGLEHLGALPNLRSVDLSANGLTDQGLRGLTSWDRVESLRLDHNRITDAGLESLRGAVKLRHLSLADNQITGPGLAHLKGLGQLDSLLLWNNPLTDAALENLAGLPKLNSVNLTENPAWSPAALQKLRRAVPQVSITPARK
jgi:Leucine-rich repeat (LRR) protein